MNRRLCVRVVTLALVALAAVSGALRAQEPERFPLTVNILWNPAAAGAFPTVYFAEVANRIAARWQSAGRDGEQPAVTFEIVRDGTVRGFVIEKTSGDPAYDRALIRVISESAPFGPFPDGFAEPSIRLRLTSHNKSK